MRIVLKILLILTFLLKVNIALADWLPLDSPILYSESGDWHSSHVGAPYISKESEEYKLLYQGYATNNFLIGKSTSIDGIHWDKTTNPILVGDLQFPETDVVEPSYLKINNTYYLWFNSFENSKENYKIRLATSGDGEIWVKHPTPVLVGTNNWEKAGVTDPSVIYHDGKFKMFYGGWGIPKSFRIGYAESDDGINWIKPSNSPLNLPSLGHVNGASISYYDNQYHLFYHTGGDRPTNIYHVKSTDLQNWQCAEEACSIIHADGSGFDSYMVTGPSVLNEKTRQLLYYGGSNGAVWNIGLAIKQLSQPQPKIIIIPGLFGSWNKEAIVYQQEVNSNAWQLNPLATDYDGLINTLVNLGLVKNQDYYVFAYDWRKSLAGIVADLDEFIKTQNLENEELNLVGHSLGGLVARAYLQESQNPNVKKIITAGSPHQGVAQVYKALSAGEIEESNSWWFLAENLVLQLYRQGIETNKEIFKNNFSILQDLLATYPYLYKNSQPINYDQYQWKNSYLTSLNSQVNNYQDLIYTLGGEKGDTIYGYKLGQRTWLDQLLGFYPEGRPIETIRQVGDLIVPWQSASLANQQSFDFDHGEMIRKKQAIKQILDELNLNYQEEQVVEGSSVDLFPSLFFLIMSNASMQVAYNSNIYSENQGVIFVPNYDHESFKIKIKGFSGGDYTILIGYLNENKTNWLKLKGEVPVENPNLFEKEYLLSIVNNQLLLNKENLNELISQSDFVDKLEWAICQNYLLTNDLKRLQSCLLKFQHRLILSLNKSADSEIPELIQTLEYLENLYTQFDFSKNHAPSQALVEKLFEHKTEIMAKKQKSNKRNQQQAYLLLQIKDRLETSNEIRLISAKELLTQIK